MKMTKYSKQKELLLETLKNTTCHPSADWVYAEARKVMPNISLGTVYRNLSEMSRKGEILKLNVDDSHDRFDGNTKPHYHLVCETCGQVTDVFVPYFKEIDNAAEKESGIEVDYHTLIFHGKCQECRNKEN